MRPQPPKKFTLESTQSSSKPPTLIAPQMLDFHYLLGPGRVAKSAWGERTSFSMFKQTVLAGHGLHTGQGEVVPR